MLEKSLELKEKCSMCYFVRELDVMFLTYVSFLALECGTAEDRLEKEETEQG